jgi:ribosomal protein S18 acetylase RimI-like enzyme
MAYTGPEPLGGKHRLEGFDCGEESLTRWLLRYSHHAEAAGSARIFVTTDDGERVVGYYALAVGQVQSADATARMLKGQPVDRPIPVVILARLAVDQAHQGQGVDRSLLQDAMLRCATVADQAGVRALVVHASNEEAQAFYRRFGFEESPTDPLHLILLMKDLKRYLDEAE